MPLTTPNLDDLRFQADLVDEARKRIIRYCPEWTEYNLSDPGITLIELFAWMTELLAYRLNRVPEKNYLSFLNLLGFQRQPASSARTDLTFWLSVPLPISLDNLQDVVVPAGQEVRTNLGESEEVIFSTDRTLRITPPLLTQVLKEGQPNRNYLPRLGLEIFYPFTQQRPRPGDSFYLGFEAKKDLSGHILQLNFTSEPTEAVGIRREDPPWVWECSLGNGVWQEVVPSTFRGEKDTTGGLNNPQGSLVLYLPLAARPDLVYGREAFWLRCRLEQRNPGQGMYTESPRVTSISAAVLGASVPATHAQVVHNEPLGKSNGEPGQQFNLLHTPVLELAVSEKPEESETLLVEEFQGYGGSQEAPGSPGEVVQIPWKLANDFSASTPYDRHFTLDPASGAIQLGPAVRQPDGVVRQYGRIPENGRSLVFRRYRYGGGSRGNLPPATLQTMMTTVAYVARVTNLGRAEGGQDQESMEEVQLRAQRELQAQKRAVTAQDYEQFVRAFSRSVARVKCLAPGPNSGKEDRNRLETGSVQLLVVPAVASALQAGDLTQLHLNAEFVRSLTRFLDQYRLLTTTLTISDPEYLGIKVVADLVIGDFSAPDVVLERANRCLRNLINPMLPYPDQTADAPLIEPGWSGWPWGRDLFTAEIHALLQRVPGVKYVLDVQIFHRPVEPALENQPNYIPAELVPLSEKALWVLRDTLLVSLDHEITCQTQSEFESKYEVD
jgi:predicted phage baseplate assembly protein